MGNAADAVDQLPLKDVVLCCTSLAKDVRTEISTVATELGATHKLDLTIDTTHLLVGDIHTAKYRYVAKSRPDIRVLRPEFIDAVRNQWMQGGDVDVDALEKEYAFPIFNGLQICITGFTTPEFRKAIEINVGEQGAKYHCDLTREVTHLIVAECRGAKYTHAKQWGISLVSYKWYTDSLTRGMMLEEEFYHPEMPIEEQGAGAFKALPVQSDASKRKRAADEDTIDENSKRKLRRVASKRLESHSQDVWQGLSAREQRNDEAEPWHDETGPAKQIALDGPRAVEPTSKDQEGILRGYFVLTRGFDKAKAKRLSDHLEPNGAVVVENEEELESASKRMSFQARILLVPHDGDSSKLNKGIPPATIVTTEWWLERCIHQKQSLDPSSDALSRPLGGIAIPAFQKLNVSTTGFAGVELRQTAEAVRLLGAAYREELLPSTSVLVCGSDNVRKEKAIYATKRHIPMVSAEWLWTCIKSGVLAPFDTFLVSTASRHLSDLNPAGHSAVEPKARREEDANGTKADDPHPKRLSNISKRFVTPTLTLKTSQQSKARPGPFILEDCDVNEPATENEATEPSNTIETAALREISPNVSQQQNENESAQADGLQAGKSNKSIAGVIEESAVVVTEADHQPLEDFRIDVVEDVITHEQQLTGQLASLIARQANSAGSPNGPPELLRRKHRPLGRNLSGISNRSNSAASMRLEGVGSPALIHEDSYGIADGFGASKEAVPPPGTQLGYDTPEAEAHRAQVNRKMGVKVTSEDGLYGGTREERVGTVRDRQTRSGAGHRRRATAEGHGGGGAAGAKARAKERR